MMTPLVIELGGVSQHARTWVSMGKPCISQSTKTEYIELT